jgi:hypothetical protein
LLPGKIIAKREGYGPTGNGGNGLLLHSSLAVEPQYGQPLGLLWQKLWNREHKSKPPTNETPKQKKQRQAKARKVARKRPFEAKESYRWVEALKTVNKQIDTARVEFMCLTERETLPRSSSKCVNSNLLG